MEASRRFVPQAGPAAPRTIPQAGFTLTEVLMVVLIIGIVAAMAAPKLDGFIRRQRVRMTLNRVAGDLAYTRMLAVRTGHGAVLRFIPAPAECPGKRPGSRRYEIARRGDRQRVVRVWDLSTDGHPLCVRTSGADTVAFNSRGLPAPYANRTIHAEDGPVRDSLTLSVVGRIYRRY